jgi:DNA-binding transcriptional LysR family regulator
MTLRQCEVFLAVAREQSFSLAAKKMHLSQPTLSEHMAELEEELGAELFVRRGRTVTLTEAGRVFHPYATQTVNAAEGGRQAVLDLGGLGRGALLVGASTTPGIYVLPSVIARFRARYPGIDLKLSIANSRTIEERVRAASSTSASWADTCWAPASVAWPRAWSTSWSSSCRASTRGRSYATSVSRSFATSRC